MYTTTHHKQDYVPAPLFQKIFCKFPQISNERSLLHFITSQNRNHMSYFILKLVVPTDESTDSLLTKYLYLSNYYILRNGVMCTSLVMFITVTT